MIKTASECLHENGIFLQENVNNNKRAPIIALMHLAVTVVFLYTECW